MILESLESEYLHADVEGVVAANKVEFKCLLKIIPNADIKEIPEDIRRAVSSADGYSYRSQKKVKRKDGSWNHYWCNQRQEYEQYDVSSNSGVRNHISKKRYNCQGQVSVFIPDDIRDDAYIFFTYSHGCFHPTTESYGLSKELKNFIMQKVASTDASAKDIYSEYLEQKEQFPDDKLVTQPQVYRWWYVYLKDKYVTHSDQTQSALNLLSKETNYKVVCDATNPSRYFAFTTPFWRLMEIGAVEETFVDATYKTNHLGFELYTLLVFEES